MIISDGRIHEFIRIYDRAYGEHLSREEARKIASRLMRLYMLMMSAEQKCRATPLSSCEESNTVRQLF